MAAKAGTGPAWARSAAPPDPARRMATRTAGPPTVAPRGAGPRAAGPRKAGFQTARPAADPRTARTVARRRTATATAGYRRATAAAGSWCPFQRGTDGHAPRQGTRRRPL